MIGLLKLGAYGVMGLFLVVLGFGALSLLGYSFVYSPTDSIKKGFWLFSTCPVEELGRRGSYAQFEFEWPEIYRDKGIPEYKYLIKKVAGIEGDSISVNERDVIVCDDSDCVTVTRIEGIPFQNVPDTIPSGHVFVVGETAGSFDSRYFGLIEVEDIYRCGKPL